MNRLQKVCVSLGLAFANACTSPAMLDDTPDAESMVEGGTSDRPDVSAVRDIPTVDSTAVDTAPDVLDTDAASDPDAGDVVNQEAASDGATVDDVGQTDVLVVDDVADFDVPDFDVPEFDVPEFDVPPVPDVPDPIPDSGVCPMGTLTCPMFGCIDPQTDNENCGACGTVCPLGRTCQGGTCVCNMGTTACAGSCVDTLTDNNNCGGCGTVCPGGQFCIAGACRIDCPMPNRICSAGAMMSCVDTLTSVNNCGACGTVCSVANGRPTCGGGMCAVAVCNSGFSNCDGLNANGCETNLSTSVTNCGICGRACSVVNGVAGCAARACVIASCNAGFGNCDANVLNGCETNLNTNVNHCGGCGAVCSFANAATECAAGVCRLGACNVGFANCDATTANGCEENTNTSITHCGRCGMRCPAVLNATPTCTAGVCGSVCNAGFSLINGRCTGTPRPIVPLSLGDVSLRRPTLRWSLAPGTDGAVVDLCRDRACTMVIESLRIMGSSTRPTNALPANRVVFWRLRSTVAAATGTAFSATWSFHVPARDNTGNIDTSSNPHLDLNGDGFDDIIVGADAAQPGGRIDAGSVAVFYGSAMGIGAVPARILEGPAAGDGFGISASSAGDVNGDGYGDLVVGAPNADPSGRINAGTASIYHGGATGIGAVPTLVLGGAVVSDAFGRSVASAGDVNGDGYGDLVVGSSNASPGGRSRAGTASVFHGSATGVSVAAARIVEGVAADDSLGRAVSGAGDVNGDGFSDIIVGAHLAAPGGRADAGTALVFHGSALGIPMAAARVLEGGANMDFFGLSVSTAGDVNGDGYSDVIVGAPNADPNGRQTAGTASAFHGSAMGINAAPTRVIVGAAMNHFLGISVSSAGDVNADGYGDVVVGAYGEDPSGLSEAGGAHVYYGRGLGLPLTADRDLPGAAAGDRFGYESAGAGDVNGDGYSDIIVSAYRADPGGRVDAGMASVFHGGAMGTSATSARDLFGVVAGDRFGWTVASADRVLPQRHARRLWVALARTLRAPRSL